MSQYITGTGLVKQTTKEWAATARIVMVGSSALIRFPDIRGNITWVNGECEEKVVETGYH
jgi:hypothetical protein